MREHFDLDPNVIYLNSGTHSLVPRQVLDAVTRYQREYERNPTRGLIASWGTLWERQKTMAKFLEGDPRDFFFRSNVTQSMNAFVMGAKLPVGSEILMSDLEYGAVVNTCRLRSERDGLGLKTFEVPLTSATAIVDAVVAALRPKTSMLVLSHVLTGYGAVLPVKEIARETRRRGVLLVVDGAHAPGALPLSFAELGDVDFYGGNLHKWMMGPKGTAFGWVNRASRDRLELIEAGWTSFEVLPQFSAFGDGDLFAHKFLLKGCFDFSPFFALKELFEFRAKLGEDAITKRRETLLKYADQLVTSKLGWKPLSPTDAALRGPLLAYELPEKLQTSAPNLMEKLDADHGLQIQTPLFRGKKALRLSPHIYNTEAEINRAVELLGQYSRL